MRTCQAAYKAAEDLLEELLKASCGTTEVDDEWTARRLAWNGRVQGGLVSMVAPCVYKSVWMYPRVVSSLDDCKYCGALWL